MYFRNLLALGSNRSVPSEMAFSGESYPEDADAGRRPAAREVLQPVVDTVSGAETFSSNRLAFGDSVPGSPRDQNAHPRDWDENEAFHVMFQTLYGDGLNDPGTAGDASYVDQFDAFQEAIQSLGETAYGDGSSSVDGSRKVRRTEVGENSGETELDQRLKPDGDLSQYEVLAHGIHQRLNLKEMSGIMCIPCGSSLHEGPPVYNSRFSSYPHETADGVVEECICCHEKRTGEKLSKSVFVDRCRIALGVPSATDHMVKIMTSKGIESKLKGTYLSLKKNKELEVDLRTQQIPAMSTWFKAAKKAYNEHRKGKSLSEIREEHMPSVITAIKALQELHGVASEAKQSAVKESILFA